MKSAIALIFIMIAPSVFAGKSSNPFRNLFSNASKQDAEIDEYSDIPEHYFNEISNLFQEEMEKIEEGKDSVIGISSNIDAKKLAAASAAHSFINIHAAGFVSNLCVKYDAHLSSVMLKKPQLTGLYHFQSSSWHRLSGELRDTIWNTFGYPVLGAVISGDNGTLSILAARAELALDEVRGLSKSKGIKKSRIIQLTILKTIVENPKIAAEYFHNSFVKAYSFLDEQSNSKQQMEEFLKTLNSFQTDPSGVQFVFNFLENL